MRRLDGLDTIPDDEEPPVAIVFWSFRVMVGLGFAMLGLGAWSLWRRVQGRLYEDRLLHRAAIVMGPMGFVAVLAGWITTEVGRQPFTVYGLLRTSDSLAPVAAPAVAASLIAFIVVYFFVFGAGTFYLLRMMNKPAATPHLGFERRPDPHRGHHAHRANQPRRHSRRIRSRAMFELSFIWAGIIAFAVLTYVILDGFDLGRRHSVPLRQRRAGEGHDDELHRAHLGRQ